MPPVLELIAERGAVEPGGALRGLQHGLWLLPRRAGTPTPMPAVALLGRSPTSHGEVVGRVSASAGVIELPSEGWWGAACGFRRPPSAGARRRRAPTPAPRAPRSARAAGGRALGGQAPQLGRRAWAGQVARRLDLGRGHRPEAPQSGPRARGGARRRGGAGRQRGGASAASRPPKRPVAHPVLTAEADRRECDAGHPAPSPRAGLRLRRADASLLEVRAERLDDGVGAQVDAKRATSSPAPPRATSTSASLVSSFAPKHSRPSRTGADSARPRRFPARRRP